MTLVNLSQSDFTSGELSKKLYGRHDLEAYFRGARLIENFIPETQGPAIFRGGFQFVLGTKDNNTAVLFKFQFSDEQAYMLEFTNTNIRIYKDRGVVLDGGSPVDVVSPYLEAELFELKLAQNATDLYIVHPNHNPRILTRTSDIAWTLSLHSPVGVVPAFAADNFPSAVGFYEQRLIYASSDDLPETVWLSKSADFDDFTIGTGATDGLRYTVATGEDVNKIEWIRGTDEFLALGGFGDILRVTGGAGPDSPIEPGSISAKPTNTFGVADQNPIAKRQKIFYMQRNQKTLLSLELNNFSGKYEPVDRNLLADNITTSGVTQIAYREGRPDIIFAAKTNGELIGATVEKQQEASSNITTSAWHRYPTDGEIISVATTPRVKDFDDVWVCVKRNIDGVDKFFIEFLNDNPEFPQREDFFLDVDNETADFERFQRALFEAQKTYIHVDSGLTFDGSTRGTDAGAILTIGAVSGSGVTFTASAAVFVAGDVGRQIWVKSVDGTRFGRAEIVTFTSDTSVDVDIIVNFDSTAVYPAGDWYITALTITGLDHLEGEVVTVVTDGSVHPVRTVSGNQITLEDEASVVHVGLAYQGLIIGMDLEGGGTTGTVQTKRKVIYKLGLRLLETLGISFGTDFYNLENRLQRQAVDLMDNPPPLFTGDEVLNFADGGKDGWAREKRVIIRQSLPLPASIQLLVPYINVSNND